MPATTGPIRIWPLWLSLPRPFAAILNPDHATFMAPGDMMAKISNFCAETNQEVPTEPGSMVRSLLEALAMRFRFAVENLDSVTRRRTKVLHLLGGGSKNRLLSQFTADVTTRPVLAGPAEATAVGNVLLQALARGSLDFCA